MTDASENSAWASQRTGLRFPPDGPPLALLDPRAHASAAEFSPAITALVVDESFRGCGIVTVQRHTIQVGDRLWIKTGPLAPLPAEVRSRLKLDEAVTRLGIMYLK